MVDSALAGYNAAGQATGTKTVFESSGLNATYSYDNDSQLTGWTNTNEVGSAVTYTYDANGNPNSTGFTTAPATR